MVIKKYRLLPIFVIIIMLLCSNFQATNFVFGQNNDASTLINSEIQGLNSDIQDRKNSIKEMQQRQEQYSTAIKEKQNEKASLNNQLAILDNRLAKSELEMEMVATDIDRVNLEIQKTNLEINDKNAQIADNKEKIAGVLRLIHKRDNVSSLEILLLNDSLAEFMSQIKYLEDINQNINENLTAIIGLKEKLEKDKKRLDAQNQSLAELQKDLEEKKVQLAAEKEDKIYILGQVNNSEKEYQRLLEQAKKEQEEAAAEIASMEKLVRAKLAQLEGGELEFNDNGLAWPVTKNVVTAYYHDPDYPFRRIFEHPGIDIRAGQGTTLKAAASGYVARVKDGGRKGYSYIMLIHGDGLSTVYGHLSKMYVNEDEYVVQGQTIGATGGMPGTPGAGTLTTGPHLHFEVRLNGIPVDPLSYLP